MEGKTELDQIKECILGRAEAKGVEVTQNLESIAKAKLRFFGLLSWYRCPCAREDEDRRCISPKCLEEIQTEGTCHCNLFRRVEK